MSYPPPQLTPQERDEYIEAAVNNYRNGFTGPVSILGELTALRVPLSEAEKIRDEFREENAKNRGAGNARG